MDTRIIGLRTAALLAKLVGQRLSRLLPGMEGYLLPTGAKLRIVDIGAGPQYAVACYTASDFDQALALVA